MTADIGEKGNALIVGNFSKRMKYIRQMEDLTEVSLTRRTSGSIENYRKCERSLEAAYESDSDFTVDCYYKRLDSRPDGVRYGAY